MINKFYFAISVALLRLVTTGSAATLNCTPSIMTLTTTTATYDGGDQFYPGPITNAGSVVCGDVTFSNLQAFDAAPPTSTGAPIVLLSGTYNGSMTTLIVNPNLNDASVNQDIHLLFSVSSTSSILRVTVGNGGSTKSGISETLCSESVSPFSGLCSGGATLASLTAAGGVTTSADLTMPSTSFDVYKDIGHPAGGELTGFSQTFTSGAVSRASDTVPEPATFAMLGGGLLALGLVRWKKVA